MAMHCTCNTLLSGLLAPTVSKLNAIPPAFLIPSIALQKSSFSTSPLLSDRSRKNNRNPARGTSALYRSGLKKQTLSVKLENLPKPVLNPEERSKVEVDEDHGLWDFFNADRAAMHTPIELHAHGRAWTVPELRKKDWNDLHRLWWVCVKEVNRLKTDQAERKRAGTMYGDHETSQRMLVISKTQKAIRHTLTERWYAWDNARHAAMEDPEINMYADVENGEVAYTPIREADSAHSDIDLSAVQTNATSGQASYSPPGSSQT